MTYAKAEPQPDRSPEDHGCSAAIVAGKRDAPGDTTDWVAVGHEEAEAQRREGDAVPTTQGMGAGGGGRKAPRTDS